MAPPNESKSARESSRGPHSPSTEKRLWWPVAPGSESLESEVRELREENARLRSEVGESRSLVARTLLAWQRECRLRTRSEAALLGSQNDFAFWFETAAFPMTCVGTDGLIEQANNLQLDLLGYSRSEYVGHRLDEFIVEGEIVEAVEAAMMGKGTFQNKQACMICKDGSEKPVLLSTEPFKQGISHGICCYVHDLSDIVEVRTEKRQNEQLFQQLSENIREVFWMTSADKSEVLYVSPAYESVWGRSCDSLYCDPRSFLEGIVEEDRQRVIDALPLQRTDGNYVQEYRVKKLDGTLCWIRDRAFPVRNENGEVYRIAGLAEDITVMKQAEEEQKNRERQQKVLSDISRLALEECSIQKVLEAATASLAETFGVEMAKILEYNPEENDFLLRAGVGWRPGLVGGTVVPGGEGSQAGYTLAVEKPVVVEDLRRETRFDGPQLLHDHEVVSGMSVVIGGQGRPFGVLGIHTRTHRSFSADDQKFLASMANILAAANERRTAELGQRELSIELARQRQKLEEIFRTLPAIVWELRIDPETGEFEQEFVSDYSETMLGYSRDEFMARPNLWRERLHPDDAERIDQEMRQILSGVRSEASEFRWIARDGRVVWISSTKRVFYDERGRQVGIRGVALDVTERKLEEERRREAEDRFDDMIKNIPGMVWEVRLDPVTGDFCPTFISGYAETLLGFPRQRWLEDNRFWLERIHPDDREKVKERMEALLAGEERGAEPLRMIARDGRVVWLESRKTVVWNGGRVPIGLRGVMVDITAREQAEEERRQAEERIRNILANVPGVVWEMRIDPETGDLRTVFVSDYIEVMSGGFTKEDFFSSRDFWVEHVHPDDRTHLRKKMAAIFRGRSSGTVVARWRRKDGRWIWIESSPQVVRDEEGRRIGLRGVTVDVTPRKQAELEREAAETRFRAFMDHSPVVALMKDEEGRFIWGNRRFMEWSRKLGLDWKGHTDREIFPPDLARRYQKLDQEALKHGSALQTQEISYEKNGTPMYWIILRFPVFDSEGRQTLGVVGIEVTEQRRLEREILEISDREQRRLGQELHDGLCQHILGIALMSRTLADRMKANHRPEAKDVQNLSDFMYEALGVVRGLMEGFNLVNITTGGGLPAALGEFANTTTKLFGKECRFEAAVEVEVTNMDVATHLFRIAQEATHNAIKHARPSLVLITLEKEGFDVLLKVKNDGSSMPEPAASSRGMGVRTMKHRADLIGATLTFENLPEGGVVVTCRMPSGSGVKVLDDGAA